MKQIGLLCVTACVSLSGCSPPNQFSEANALMKSHVADDITLTIDEASETRHPHIDGTYSVCGRTRLQESAGGDQPAKDETIRFMVNVHDGRGGGYFDGSTDPLSKAQYNLAWDRLCGPGSANQPLIPPDDASSSASTTP